LCRDLGVGTLVVACDAVAPLSAQDFERLRLSLREIAQRAQDHDIRIALEFQARSAIGNNLQTALALVEEVSSPALGICLDVFHFYVGPSKTSDLVGLTSQNLFHVQFSDLADVPREFASDSDRIVPGDGDIQLEPIIEHLRDIGYSRCVSMELMNPQIWRIPARQFGEIAMTAMRKLLGQAQMPA
jgi:sugar phosphate isomerase/epimerase